MFYDNWESYRTQGKLVARGERIAKLQQDNEMKKINANPELHALPTIEETEGIIAFEEIEANSSEPTTPAPLDSSDSQLPYASDALYESQMIPLGSVNNPTSPKKSRWHSQRELGNLGGPSSSKWSRSRNSPMPLGRGNRSVNQRRNDNVTPLIDFAT